MAYQRGRSDYAAIAVEAMNPATQPVEITEEEYLEMRGCLPPIIVPGGFLVPEPICGSALGPVVAHFARRDRRHLARYAVQGARETYIK